MVELFILIAVVQDSGVKGSKMYSYLRKKKGQIIPSPHNNTTYYLSTTKPHLDMSMLRESLERAVCIFLSSCDGRHDATRQP